MENMDIMILLVFTMVCALSDLQTHKIPNRLILCGLIWAVMCRVFWISQGGILCLWDGIAGLIIPIVLIGPLAALKMIGGGDVKLLAVIGLLLGAKDSINIICASFLYAAIWSAVIVIRRRNLFYRFQILYRYLVKVMATGRLSAYRTEKSDPSGELCFALPVLAALCTLFLYEYLH